MKKFFHELGEILGEGILAFATLLAHVAVGLFLLSLPAIVHPYVHWLYGDTPPMLIGNVSLVEAIHAFDYAIGFGIMGVGGVKAVLRFWR